MAASDRKCHSHWLEKDKGGFSRLIEESGRTLIQVRLDPGAMMTPSPPPPLFLPPPLSSAYLCTSSIVMHTLPLGWQDGCQQPQASTLFSQRPQNGRAMPFTQSEGKRVHAGSDWTSLGHMLIPEPIPVAKEWDSLIARACAGLEGWRI